MELDIALRLRVHVLAEAVTQAHLPGIIDLTPGIRSLQIHYDSTTLSRRDLLDALDRTGARSAAGRRDEGAEPHRASAAVVERSAGACWRCANIRNWCGPTRRGARRNIEFIRRINGLDDRRGGEAYRVRCELSRAGSRRRLSRRAGGDAGRSAAPAGDHEIQSGAHLDAGKRRRHRRRLYVHLRHGRAGRLSAVRPHHPDVEFLALDPDFRPAIRGCCGSSTRSDSSR